MYSIDYLRNKKRHFSGLHFFLLQGGVWMSLAWWLLFVNLARSLDFCCGKIMQIICITIKSDSSELKFPHVYGKTTSGVLLSHQTPSEWGVIRCLGCRIYQISGQCRQANSILHSCEQMLLIGCRIIGSLSNFLGICTFWNFIGKWRLLSPPSTIRKYCSIFIWN